MTEWEYIKHRFTEHGDLRVIVVLVWLYVVVVAAGWYSDRTRNGGP